MSGIGTTCLIHYDQAAGLVRSSRGVHDTFVEPAPTTTAELTRRMARGDTDALTVFNEQWFDTMYHEARRTTGRDESFCLDVVQDALVRVIRKISPMEREAQLAAWLRRVVRSCAYDRLRSDVARAKREAARCDNVSDSGAADGPGVSAAGDAEERLKWLRAEIDSLDEGLRRPLLLRVLSGWTLAQIGAVLGLSPGAVDGRVNRAMTTLRKNAERFDE